MYPIQLLCMALFVLALGLVILHHLGPKYDSREPPVIPQKIPYVGHLLSLLVYGHNYLERISKKHHLPIYTLQILTKRIYVICSPDLVVAAQKNTKDLSFGPFVVAFIPRMFDIGKKDTEILALNHDSEEGNWGYMPELREKAYSTAAPGSDMDCMVRTALDTVTGFFSDLDKKDGNRGSEIDLHSWIRDFVSLSVTEALYGPENPFKHEPGLLEAFWDYEAGLTKLILGIFPKYTAPTAYSARLKFSSAMHSYFLRNGQDQASPLQKARYEVSKKNGMSLEAISTLEIGDCIATLINTNTMVFWMIWHIYSSPNLLQQLRDEVANILSETNDEGGKHLKLNVGNIKSDCPHLFSTYQEVLRVRTHTVTQRWVLADTLLSNRYLLKKDNVVEMPGQVIHTKASVWGPDVNDFNSRRFMKSQARTVKPGSLRSFGGGITLCPGRHFATMKIVSVVAMMIVRFDITPLSSKGWVDPHCVGGKVVTGIPAPASDIKAVVSARNDYEGVQWEFDGIGGERAETARFEVT